MHMQQPRKKRNTILNYTILKNKTNKLNYKTLVTCNNLLFFIPTKIVKNGSRP